MGLNILIVLWMPVALPGYYVMKRETDDTRIMLPFLQFLEGWA